MHGTNSLETLNSTAASQDLGNRQIGHCYEQQSEARRSVLLLTQTRLTVILLALLLGAGTTLRAQDLPATFDGKRAFGYLEKICAIGTRISGSEGMARQQQLVIDHFRKLGEVRAQGFDVAHPVNGAPVRMTNLIVSFHPTAKERVLLCCHYDTRPFPDRDLFKPRGTFIGANDGASGVALFMELGQHLKNISPKYGVDIVFFDGEELVYRSGDKFFHGSEYFATQYRRQPPEYRYVCGVLVDMIAGKKLAIHPEKASMRLAPSVTKSVFATAKRLGIKEFSDRPKHEVSDDHIPLNEIGKIPTTDLIDFDYSHWHTTKDVPASCSAESLEKVGRVLIAWLQEVPQN